MGYSLDRARAEHVEELSEDMRHASRIHIIELRHALVVFIEYYLLEMLTYVICERHNLWKSGKNNRQRGVAV